MNNVLRMKVLHSTKDISGYNRSYFLCERTIALQQREEMSITAELHQQIYIFSISEEVIKLDYIRVVQVHLQFYLVYQAFQTVLF